MVWIHMDPWFPYHRHMDICMNCSIPLRAWTPRVQPSCHCKTDLYCVDCFGKQWMTECSCRKCGLMYKDQRGIVREIYEYRTWIPLICIIICVQEVRVPIVTVVSLVLSAMMAAMTAVCYTLVEIAEWYISTVMRLLAVWYISKYILYCIFDRVPRSS
jgi:hypothetical protein